ncbi:unnamed protein product [Plutella xylostella]|uniref:(diamondback moth) hypothetical protein n=1 Tax=Plutella xylostella TaxID=51655 RepID=A0A8S4G5V8_PLUXY|nr:unnamed protein product [Plutella xylostella]
MTSIMLDDKFQNDKCNGLSATFVEKGAVNSRNRSKSLSSDKLNNTNADRAAILEDVEAHHITDKSETPGCLVQNRITDLGSQKKENGVVQPPIAVR